MESPRSEPRPLPAFPESPRQDRATTQRVRLRLDPAVASQPLPNAAQLVREPLAPAREIPAEISAAAVDAPVPPDVPEESFVLEGETFLEPKENFLPPAGESVAEESFVDRPVGSPADEIAQAAAEPAPEVFEMPAVAETMERVWVPPGPGHAAPSTWLPPVTTRPLAPSDLPRPVLATSPAEEVAAEKSPEAYESRRLPRPELRRYVTPLAQLAKPEQASLGPGFWILLALIVAALLGVLYFFIVAPRLAASQAQAPLPAPPRPVMFVVARKASPAAELPVSGTVEPSRETPLYARTTGYVKSWSADLGDKVQSGQVLAELDTPEVDHQLTQARASADQAMAQVELAQNEADRWAKMAQDHAVSQSDADAKTAALNEAQANFNAAEANVGRLADLEMFKEIRAPYAGIITARNLEVGTLVGAGPDGKELFRVTQTDPVRVFVNVPEASAPAIHAGIDAKVSVAAYPGREFAGQVARDAGTLDGTTHTLRTEIYVSNPDGALLPGTVASVRLQIVDATPALLVPASSLIMSRQGAAIACLASSDGREVVHMMPVQIGRTFGAEVELLGNPLNPGDRLVANPPADLQDGMVVSARPYVDPPDPPALLPPHASAPRA